MKPRAIVFDMDGVLLDSERAWHKVLPAFRLKIGLPNIPPEVEEQTYGLPMSVEHAILVEHTQLKLTLDEFIAAYDYFAQDVYTQAPLAAKLPQTLKSLKAKDIKLAVVTASVESWYKLFITRLGYNPFDYVVPLADRRDLRQKPSPDGYLETMKALGVTPAETYVIEDSNRGIAGGKASGAYVVASHEFISPEYQQIGFDTQIQKLEELPALLQ